MKGRPFAMLGVNADESPQMLRRIMAENGINWRNWWNGSNPGKAIDRDWDVSAWPTIHVIDADGIIRRRNLSGPELDEVVEELVRNAEAKQLAIPDAAKPQRRTE